MTRRILFAALSAILAGCHARDNSDFAYTSSHIPYSKSAYQAGRLDAEADLRAGRLVLEDYGFPRKGQAEYAQILQQRHHIELRRVASDILDPMTYGHAFGYNVVSRAEIKRRFGDNVLKNAEADAAKHYDEQLK
jgi:hypothetical protein